MRFGCGLVQSAGAVDRAVSITEGTTELAGNDAQLYHNQLLGKAASALERAHSTVQLNWHEYFTGNRDLWLGHFIMYVQIYEG